MFLQFVTKYWKALGILVLCMCLLLSGYYWGKNSNLCPQGTETKDKITQTTTTKTDIVTKIVEKPDGSKETTITQHQDETTKTKDTSETTTSSATAQAKYHGGAFFATRTTDIFKQPEITYGFMAGTRVAGPFWFDGSYNIKTKDMSLGFSMEF